MLVTALWRYPVKSMQGESLDSAKCPISLVYADTFRTSEPRRFRINVTLTGAGEDALVDRTVDLGTTGLMSSADAALTWIFRDRSSTWEHNLIGSADWECCGLGKRDTTKHRG